MTVYGTLRRATAISFDELRALLDASDVWQSTTALPDGVVVGISAPAPALGFKSAPWSPRYAFAVATDVISCTKIPRRGLTSCSIADARGVSSIAPR